MNDIGKVKALVPIQTGTFTLGDTGFIYKTHNGKSFLISYKTFDSLMTKRSNYGKFEQDILDCSGDSTTQV